MQIPHFMQPTEQFFLIAGLLSLLLEQSDTEPFKSASIIEKSFLGQAFAHFPHPTHFL